MPHILHPIVHALKDTVIILPILFVTYLIIEFIEHKAGEKVTKILTASGKAGPLLGSIVGIVGVIHFYTVPKHPRAKHCRDTAAP